MTENENEQPETPELELPTDEQVEAFGSLDDAVAAGEAFVVGDEDPGADVIQQLQDQLKDAEKRVLMAQADLENFRRRVRRESQEQIKYAPGGLMTDLLESVDNLQRAVEAYEADPNGDGLRDGVQLVTSQIIESLSKHDCKPIEAEGQPFDPNLHQALQMQPSKEHPANTVIQDLRTGFQLFDRVLRPSQVFVSTGEQS
jgi:molecular chaperone GrpE